MTDDTEPLEDSARHTLALFEQISSADIPNLRADTDTTVPVSFVRLLQCFYGALRQQIRLAREIDTMRRNGVLDVDVLVDTKNETAIEQ